MMCIVIQGSSVCSLTYIDLALTTTTLLNLKGQGYLINSIQLYHDPSH